MSGVTRTLIWDPGTRLAIERLAVQGMRRGARALTQLIGEPVQVKGVSVERVMLSELAAVLPDRAAESVGVFLVSRGDLQDQFLLLLSLPEALALADLMLGRWTGVTSSLDPLARSALGEAGNQLSAKFLDLVAEATHRAARLSPPAVLVDMAGALVELWLTARGRLEDYLLIIDATFTRAGQEAGVHFWILPQYVTLRAIAQGERHV